MRDTEPDHTMIRFVARWDQNLKCRSKQIRQGERTLLENRPLCHDNNGLNSS